MIGDNIRRIRKQKGMSQEELAAGTLTMKNFEMVTLCAVLGWVGLPAGISYIYYVRKVEGRQ